MARFCTQCGNELDAGAIYCSSCGTKAEENYPAINNTWQMNYVPVQKSKKKGPLIIAASLLIFVAIIGISVVFMTRPTPEKTINRFVRACNNLDVDGMMECLEPDAQAIYKEMEALLSGLTNYNAGDVFRSILGYKGDTDDGARLHVSMKVKDIQYNSGTKAVVEVECSYFDGEETSSTTESINMVKIDGKWYISLIGGSFW